MIVVNGIPWTSWNDWFGIMDMCMGMGMGDMALVSIGIILKAMGRKWMAWE
jgi:hypothetical protein